jgi:hypothetical protein
MHHLDERGQVAPLLAVIAVAVGVACLALGRFGADAAAVARAQSAADAAALAAAGGADDATVDAVARANGAEVERFEAEGGDVRVRVRLGDHRAAARARGETGSGGVPGDSGAPDSTEADRAPALAPVLRAALARAQQLLGEPVPVTSGYRSPATQQRLWLRRATNPYPVAPPGTSMHERGLAVDVPSSFAERLAAVGARGGLCRPYPTTDPVHFEPC